MNHSEPGLRCVFTSGVILVYKGAFSSFTFFKCLCVCVCAVVLLHDTSTMCVQLKSRENGGQYNLYIVVSIGVRSG